MGKGDVAYKHFVPAARPAPEYPAKNTHHLVKSIDELKEIFSNQVNYIAWDTETSSLSPEEGEIVGFSFAFSAKEGWYCPVNHIGYKHNLGRESLELFYNYLTKCKKTFVFNMRFDYRFMEYAGFDMSKVPYLDVSVLVQMADSNVKMMSLKKAESHFLGWSPDTFEETLGDSVSFQYLDPSEGFAYACADAEATFALAGVCSKYYQEAKIPCQLDNGILYPLMKFEDNPVDIDVDYLRKIAEEETKDISRLEREIINEVGYEFKIASNRQLGEALLSLGINTGHFTKTGQMKVDIKTLALMTKDHPVLEKIITLSKKVKAVNSYMNELADQASASGNKLRFAYLTGMVPCLTKDNVVFIRGKGLVSVAEVSVGDLIWTQYGWKKVLWNNKKWSSEIWDVKLANGFHVTGTGHHPVLVNHSSDVRQWKPEWCGIQGLKVGECVVCQHNQPDSEWWKSEVSSKAVGERASRSKFKVPEVDLRLARLVGFIDGNGSVAQGDRIKLCFNESDKELIEYYTSLFTELTDLRGVFEKVGPDHTQQVCYFSVALRNWFVGLGCRGNGVPEFVKRGGPGLWREYLAGLWDSDGSLCQADRHGKNIQWSPRLKLTKERTVWESCLMLTTLGVPSAFRKLCETGPRHQRWCAEARGWIGRCMFRDQVASLMKSPEKVKRAFENQHKFTQASQSRVEYVEKFEAGDWVYDIEVEDVHEFIANGVVTHNTGRLAAGGDKKNPYFAHINVQSIPKPHPCMWYVHDYHEGDEVKPGEKVILKWLFSRDRKSPWMIEGFDQKSNVRSAFCVAPGSVWVSCDFCIDPNALVELRDGSKITLRSLEGKEVEIKTPFGFKKASNFRYTGFKKKCRLRLKDGREVLCSPDHQFKVNRDGVELWVPFRELKKTDYVITD